MFSDDTSCAHNFFSLLRTSTFSNSMSVSASAASGRTVHRFEAGGEVDIGLVVWQVSEDVPAVVYSVQPNSQAGQCGIKPGQPVYKVNGVETATSSRADVRALIKFSSSICEIEVGPATDDPSLRNPIEKARDLLDVLGSDPVFCASAMDESAVQFMRDETNELIQRAEAVPDDDVAQAAKLLRRLTKHIKFLKKQAKRSTWMQETMVVPGIVKSPRAGCGLREGQQVAFDPSGGTVIAFLTERSAWKKCSQPVNMRFIRGARKAAPLSFHDFLKRTMELGHDALQGQMNASALTPSRHSARSKRRVNRYVPY